MKKLATLLLTLSSIVFSISASSQSYRVEKDEFGEMKIPSNAYYGMNGARAIKHFNVSNVFLNEYPELIKAMASVKLAATESNRLNGDLKEDDAMMISRACHSLINGEYPEPFKFDIYNGSQGYFPNAVVNEVLTNLAIEMTGANRGNYKVIDPSKDVNLHQNYKAVYQTALNISIVSQNEALMKEIEVFTKALKTFNSKLPDAYRKSNTTTTPTALSVIGANLNNNPDSLLAIVAKLQIQSSQLKYHTMNGSDKFGENLDETKFSKQFETEILKASGLNLNYENPVKHASKHYQATTVYMGILKELSAQIIEVSNVSQLVNSEKNEKDPFAFANLNGANSEYSRGFIINKMVSDNCETVLNKLTNQESISAKNTQFDNNLYNIEIVVSQQILIRAMKSVRENYFQD